LLADRNVSIGGIRQYLRAVLYTEKQRKRGRLFLI
jgi:hypothetical protein